MKEHIESLRALRDFLVADRRNLVTSILADPHAAGDAASDLMNLQQFIDTVERAISHEQSLDRPQGAWPPKPQGGAAPQLRPSGGPR